MRTVVIRVLKLNNRKSAKSFYTAGRDKVASLWVALALWAAAAASESRLVSQPALLAAAWVALFTLPPAYALCRCGGSCGSADTCASLALSSRAWLTAYVVGWIIAESVVTAWRASGFFGSGINHAALRSAVPSLIGHHVGHSCRSCCCREHREKWQQRLVVTKRQLCCN